MKWVLEKLELPAFEMTFFEYDFYFTSVRDDKIVFLFFCDNIERVWEFTNAILDMREEVFKIVRNKSEVKTRIPIPAFLWDLYVVAVHDLTSSPPFDKLKIDQIERDRFIARKIIIEYNDESELLEKFTWCIRPEIELDRLLMEVGPELDESINAKRILHNVKGLDIEGVNYRDIIEHLNIISKKFDLDD